MKKCTWCGKEYTDEANACAIDGQPLEVIPPSVSANLEGVGVNQADIQVHKSMRIGRRPKGIWIVTIWMALFAGLLPIAAALFMYFGVPEEHRIMSASGLVVSLSIALAIIASAACAWLGFAWARFALIALAVIHYGLIALNLYTFWQSGAVPESRHMFVWTRMARSLITMTLVVLYLLLSRTAKDFFKHYRHMANVRASGM